MKDWKPTDEKPWLGIIGETGTCKSRIACLLAATEMERLITTRHMDSPSRDPAIPSFLFVPCYEVLEIAAQVQTGTFEEKARARDELDDFRSADFLVLDDLGKGRMSAGNAAEMFALVDHRFLRLRPTIWTANSTPEQIATKLPEDMAGPFAGRLNDSSRIFRFR